MSDTARSAFAGRVVLFAPPACCAARFRSERFSLRRSPLAASQKHLDSLMQPALGGWWSGRSFTDTVNRCVETLLRLRGYGFPSHPWLLFIRLVHRGNVGCPA